MLAGHHALIRSALAGHGGREVDTQGDAFFAVFSSPRGCVAAVLAMQQAMAARAHLGREQLERANAQGMALSLEKALDLALPKAGPA